ncbi:hypothetical protein L1987_06409 [Smallanthus sonchifolius]|uniref:Uncharacterized protein n=1 Tax=Smallanthus sonchifolius TaxID=185202 RepID=A0ACB9JY69_9ASTR|nr:hypothetical protein L1987_06409 [Smallanthus sonchifolius]
MEMNGRDPRTKPEGRGSRCPISYALTMNPKLYNLRIREFWETAMYAFLEKKHTITATVDGKPMAVTIQKIITHLHIDDVGVSSNHDGSLPTSPIITKEQVTEFKGEYPNKSLLQMRKGTAREGRRPDMQSSPKDPINSEEGKSKDSKKLDEDKLGLTELTAQYESLATDVSTLQTSLSTLQDNQMVAIHLASGNNTMLKTILYALDALSKPRSSSNPMGAKVSNDATKKGENKIMRWKDGSLEDFKDYESATNSTPCIFSSQDRQWLLRNYVENIESPKTQTMQNNIRRIFKEALKRKVEALDRQVSKRVRVESA